MKNYLVDPRGLSGGLALFWKTSYEFEVLHSDKIIIVVNVKLESLSFFISFVYGDLIRHLHQEVWNRLTDIGSTRDDAWIVVGDLNELMDNSEKIGGPLRDKAMFHPFRSMINNCRLKEVPSSGNIFSWGGT